MSQDIVSDALNQIMNAKKASKNSVRIHRHSKLLQSILAIGKLKGYIEDFKIDGTKLYVKIGKLNYCRAVKPRYVVKSGTIDKYRRRYLPARDMGILIISTNEGLVTHQTSIEKNKGGCIVAYFY